MHGREIKLSGRCRSIGDGHPCFIIAEAGSNHNGSLDTARALIDVAAEAKADAVKFQIFRAKKLYPQGAGTSDYLKVSKRIYDIIAEMEMPYEWLPKLQAHCKERGILFMASAFDEESLAKLDPFVEIHKIASYEMTHLPLVRAAAKAQKPVLISTGTATLDEIAETVDAFRRTGNAALALFQCTAAYPAPLDSLNIRTIPRLKARFQLPVGLSDHSRDPVVGPIAAVACGASMIEKHFTLSNQSPGPDHRFAVEPGELTELVSRVREAEQALGDGEKRVHEVERELRTFARRSIFSIQPIAVGETFTRENIAVLRCGKLAAGLAPKDFDSLLQKKARRAIPRETAIEDDDVA